MNVVGFRRHTETNSVYIPEIGITQWVEFDVGSRPFSEGFSPVFPPSSKFQQLKRDLLRRGHLRSVDGRTSVFVIVFTEYISAAFQFYVFPSFVRNIIFVSASIAATCSITGLLNPYLRHVNNIRQDGKFKQTSN